MIFFLGTHQVDWLHRPEFVNVPLFISVVRLRRIKKLVPATTLWAMDSGGFSALSKHGGWQVTPQQYVKEVDRWLQIGGMQWAATQDWMCEDKILLKTGKTVLEHQQLTVQNYQDLLALRTGHQGCPVLQGYTLDDYKRCLDMYQEIPGIDLFKLPIVGIGTMCRRQGTKEAQVIIKHFAGLGLKIHAFGFKKDGLPGTHRHIISSDSLAWSADARLTPIRLPGCQHKKCASCEKYALLWRSQLLKLLK